jgi:phosphonate transport system substrate-binding protein
MGSRHPLAEILLKLGFVILLILMLGLSPASATESVGQTVYSVGIVPQQSATRLARLWTPILKYLGEESDLTLRFKTAPNIPTFEERVAVGEYHFAYMNPYHYTVFHQAPGYVSFAHAANKRIKGIVIVRKDSTISDLKGLQGATMAFPAPAAFAASVPPRAHFRSVGIPITPKYVSSHDSVYRSVAKGLYPAGGGVIRTFRNMEPAIRDQLRILRTTDGYTPHAFAAHPDVAVGIVDRLQRAMLGMQDTEAGRALLGSIKVEGFQYAHDSAWDDVRALGIKLLDQLVKQ